MFASKGCILALLFMPICSVLFAQLEAEWASSVHGIGNEGASNLAVDGDQNSFHIGTFSGSLFIDGDTLVSEGQLDMFLIKLGPDGEVIWYQAMGGPGTVVPWDIALGLDGEIIITGKFSDTLNFQGTLKIAAGVEDMFLAKMDENGNLIWINTITATGFTPRASGESLELDRDGFIYVSGVTYPFTGCCNITIGDSTYFNVHGYVAKYHPAGVPLWSVPLDNFATPGSDIFYSPNLSLDAFDNLLVSADYDDGSGNRDGFLVKLDSVGNILWNSSIKALDEEFSYVNHATDSLGNSYLLATFAVDVTINDSVLVNAVDGLFDVLIVKYKSNGEVDWTKVIDSDATDFAWDVTINRNAEPWVLVDLEASLEINDSLTLVDYSLLKLNPSGDVIDGIPLFNNNTTWVRSIEAMDNFLYLSGAFETVSIILGSTEITPLDGLDAMFYRFKEPCNLHLINFLGGDSLTFCSDQGVSIVAYNEACNFDYQWSTGESGSSIMIDPDTTVNLLLTVSDSMGNQIKDSVIVRVFNPPIVNLGEDQVICAGESLVLDAGPAYESYLWSTGETTQGIELNQAGDYWVMVTNEIGCQATDTVQVVSEICTGLPDITGNGITIYPNPNQGQFAITTSQPLDQLQLQIIDVQGKQHFYQELQNVPSGELTVKVIIPKGLYILFLETKQQRYQSKLLIK